MAFDLMIVAGIGSIDIMDLRGLWLPFILMSLSGAIVTLYYLIWMSKKIYPGYENEGMLGMYGMMTGTISSGILLLREMDPYFDTPAANNLVGGSSFAIVFGAPMLILIGLAPRSSTMAFMTLGLMIIYMGLLHIFMTRKAKTVTAAEVEEDR
jgi:ESS family glutamate:Na+ symporter